MDTAVQVVELCDADEARRFVVQGLWLQRVQTVRRPAAVAPILAWALELAGEGEPLPPVGFIADVGHLVFAAASGLVREALPIADWPAGLVRAYEDYVLGRLLGDDGFERAGAAARHYRGRDQARGLAFLLGRLRERAGAGGVVLNPALLKALRDTPGDEVLAAGWDSLRRQGLSPLLHDLYTSLVKGVRHAGELLGPEDVFELEHGTAVAQFGQRLALRQVLHAARALQEDLPRQKPPAPARPDDVPTRLVEEDAYPAGGFASLSTRGSIESLLHSQLAYMEPHERPDLFDIKFVRDELLYYARDDNRFWRRRRSFVFALDPELTRARFKDPELPYQRMVLLLALIVAAVERLGEWFSTEALLIDLRLLQRDGPSPLAAEQELLEVLLREPIEGGTVRMGSLAVGALAAHCEQLAQRSRCEVVLVGPADAPLVSPGIRTHRLIIDGPVPVLRGEDAAPPQDTPGLAGWARVLGHLLRTCL